MCKFAHFRNFNESGDVFGNVIEVKGGVTVAYEETEDRNGNEIVTYAVAHCSPRDNFCRKTGRVIAEGRLKAGKGVQTLEDIGDKTVYEALLEVI